MQNANNKYYDIVIVGSGMSGLYSAYNIKKMSPNTSFIILEKFKKKWIGGRSSNEMFYGEEIVTGAGIGRKRKDKLLHKLLVEMNLPAEEYNIKINYSPLIDHVDINKIMDLLRKKYRAYENKNATFSQFAKDILGEKLYKQFILSAGYTDYENEDIIETLYYYGMDDNGTSWKAFHVPWKKLVMKLYQEIGDTHFRFSSGATKIIRQSKSPNLYMIETENGANYYCNKLILATTISSVKKLLPDYRIYDDIKGQPFLRLYGKFSASSIPILKQYVKGFTFLPGPLQRIIPINQNKGIYMIAYNDNKNTIALKNYLENNSENRAFYCGLLEKALGIQPNSLQLNAIKDFYWSIGTHYYTPLDKTLYKDRENFVEKAQHPEKCMLVVGEMISRNQGWTEGALESVKAVLNKKWVTTLC
jgi:hypothetical protein